MIAYVKDEGANLAPLAMALSFVATCMPLGMTMPYAGVCVEHAMSKKCQYATSMWRHVKGEHIEGSNNIAKKHNIDKEGWEGETIVR